MKFLALLLMLSSDYWLDAVKRLAVFPVWSRYVASMTRLCRSWMRSSLVFVLVVSVLPAVIVGILYCALSVSILYGLLGLLWAILILLTTLSPIKQVFDCDDVYFSVSYFFAPFFWFVLLGPFGAVMYAVTVLLQQSDDEEIVSMTSRLLSYYDIIPVKLLGLSFALVGHFSSVFTYWFDHILSGPGLNQAFLSQCFSHVIEFDQKEEACVRRQLIVRSIIIWLAVTAIVLVF
jgi:membrane protein required for beta-lactamase induction